MAGQSWRDAFAALKGIHPRVRYAVLIHPDDWDEFHASDDRVELEALGAPVYAHPNADPGGMITVPEAELEDDQEAVPVLLAGRGDGARGV